MTQSLRHFVSIAQSEPTDLQRALDRAAELRRLRQAGEPAPPLLAGRTVGLIFEKPSLRTRVSFEQAVYELGGQTITMSGGEVGLGKRESVEDVVRVLGGMLHVLVARVFEHEKLKRMAAADALPIINALSDYAHPCQALADALTLRDEFGADLTGRTLAFIGDGNNVARSLAMICGKLGANFVLSSPPGYELEQAFQDRIMAQVPSMNFEMTSDPRRAVQDADAIYTDTWTSMGQEAEQERRLAAFKGFALDEDLLAAAPGHAIVLHCLPAKRGVEITNDVMDGPRSRVFQQAHNRLHAQKGLLAQMFDPQA